MVEAPVAWGEQGEGIALFLFLVQKFGVGLAERERNGSRLNRSEFACQVSYSLDIVKLIR